MEDKQIGVPTNVAVFIDYENVYKALLEEKTNVLRLAFFEKLRKWCSEHQRRVVRIVVYCNFDNMDLHESFHQSVLQSYPSYSSCGKCAAGNSTAYCWWGM